MPQRMFERHMRYLKERYRVISLEEAIANLKDNKCIDCDSVVITFDVGYEDNFLEAVPVLKRYDLPAAFFLTVDYMGKRNYLDWSEIRAMKDEGFEFGCHTISHPRLPNLDEDEVHKEVAVSKRVLEERLEQKIRYFSYPYGDFNQRIAGIVKDAGFEAAVSVVDGPCDHKTGLFSLKRKEILTRPFSSFAVKIEGLFEPFLKLI